MRRLWQWLTTPNARRSTGFLLVIGGIAGVVFWGGFNTFMEYTSTYRFCTGCHEMSWVDAEYQETVHFQNPAGVRAICADCHVPRPWGAKLLRKIRATVKEVPGKILRSIDTREKFDAKRLELAESVWAEMKANNSRECRNCHHWDTMDLANQRQRAKVQHEDALKTGETCIDCHKGIAHHKPETEEEEQTEQQEGGFTL